MAHLHNTIRPRWILGLTATPFRTDRIKLCFDKVIKDAGIHQLIQDGFLSQYDHYTIPCFNVRTVAEFFLREPSRWGKTIFFFRKLEECFELHELLASQGVVCDVVTGTSDREQQIERFKSGQVPVLINCMVLSEGFDCPDLQTVFCRDSAKGPTMQMCGRAFRKHPDAPVKNIVQSKLTKWPFTKVALARQQFLWQEDEWRSLSVNPMINTVNSRARLAIANITVELPQFVKRNRARHPGFFEND
jgi:superfamily II DNA or RNA helicase